MAHTSICPNPECKRSNNFELADANVKGCKYKIFFVQCATCGTVISTMEYYNISNLILQLAEKLHVPLES